MTSINYRDKKSKRDLFNERIRMVKAKYEPRSLATKMKGRTPILSDPDIIEKIRKYPPQARTPVRDRIAHSDSQSN